MSQILKDCINKENRIVYNKLRFGSNAESLPLKDQNSVMFMSALYALLFLKVEVLF